MAQQMVNGSKHMGSVAITNPMSDQYAVVNPPFEGLHKKPQDQASKSRRHAHWVLRNNLRTSVGKE